MRSVLSCIALAVACALVLSFSPSLKAADEKPAEKSGEKGTIKVIVNDESGKPVEGAAVQITKRMPRPQPNQQAAAGDNNGNNDNNNGNTQRQRRPRPEPVAKATTDAKGIATLSDVPVGEYNLSARKTDIGNARKRIKIEATNNADVTLTLKKRQTRRQGGQGEQGAQTSQNGQSGSAK
jgi:hypothetical protein